MDGNIIGELARRKVQKYENTVQLQRHNNHICYVNNINAVFQFFSCPECDTFFYRTFNFERPLTTCKERVKNVYPKNVYQTQGTLFDKLVSFGNEYTNEQTLFKKLVFFTLNQIACKKKASKTPKQENGSESIFPSLLPFPQILLKNQFSSATLILIISLLLLLVLLKI